MIDEVVEQVCGHELCNCLVEDDSAYCSLYCEEADEAEAVGSHCDCGHLGCVGEPS